jgi:hypothetical protein
MAGNVQGLMWHNAASGSSGNDFWDGNKAIGRAALLGQERIDDWRYIIKQTLAN